jgi:endoglucanase
VNKMDWIQRSVLMICFTAFLNVNSTFGVIHLNQIGYYPDDKKLAIVVGTVSDSFSVVSAQSNSVIYSGVCTSGGNWDASEETTQVVDFSNFETQGEYKIRVKGQPDSYPFQIRDNVHLELAKGAIEAYYFNRASIALAAAYADKWTRTAGHMDNIVRVHSTAASEQRPANVIISSPGGWYDAGDYGKYIVNSGISTYTLLLAYQVFANFYDTLKLTIPESSNNIPDLLDEILWNLRWMLTMQDPNDGGVYHKLTTLKFSDNVMPATDRATRYVFKKSTAAALDFAAVTAQASRILHKFDPQLPGLADSCLQASKKAWAWARKNPTEVFVNPSDVNTGEYGNKTFSDEFYWAGTELYISTKEDSFYTIAKEVYAGSPFDLPGWPEVATLGNYSLFVERNKLSNIVKIDSIVLSIDTLANRYAQRYLTNPYRTSMVKKEFYWGSNSVAANQGMVLLIGFMATGKKSYKDAAIGTLDYLLGKNPNAYCFVTGFGDKQVMNIHHRPSVADDVEEPVPGFLCGGPNAQQNEYPSCEDYDGCPEYPFPKGTKVAMSYADQIESYASNEIAINWNAPLVFLSGGCESFQKTTFSGIKLPRQKSGESSSPTVYFRRPGSFAIELPSGSNGTAVMVDLRGTVLHRVNMTGKSLVTISSARVRQAGVIYLDITDVHGKKQHFVYKVLRI